MSEDPITSRTMTERAAYVLAMLGLQSARYQTDSEYRDAVDDVLASLRAESKRKEYFA